MHTGKKSQVVEFSRTYDSMPIVLVDTIWVVSEYLLIVIIQTANVCIYCVVCVMYRLEQTRSTEGPVCCVSGLVSPQRTMNISLHSVVMPNGSLNTIVIPHVGLAE